MKLCVVALVFEFNVVKYYKPSIGSCVNLTTINRNLNCIWRNIIKHAVAVLLLSYHIVVKILDKLNCLNYMQVQFPTHTWSWFQGCEFADFAKDYFKYDILIYAPRLNWIVILHYFIPKKNENNNKHVSTFNSLI